MYIKGGNAPMCRAYIIGDFWALTTKFCVLNKDVNSLALFNFAGAIFHPVKNMDTTGSKFSHLDIALLKVEKSMVEQGMVVISPDMPQEGAQLYESVKLINTTVISYDNCTKIYGNFSGTFCSTQNSIIQPSSGLFENGMLTGISISYGRVTNSVSAAYVTSWILDTMSEIKQ
ncbi:uncharacterized protein LOC106662481 isoform X2 [Cimex lectularius]|nr:uncharacterized protein LOC106662481 isoform X2 [Cimex lectularius]